MASPVVAANPTRRDNLVVVEQDAAPVYAAALQWSVDGGRSWGHTSLPLPPGTTAQLSGPDLAFAPDGSLYVVYLSLHGRGHTPEHLWLARSSDGGRSLSAPVSVAAALAFQPRVAVGAPGGVVVTYVQATAVGQLSLPGPTTVEAVTSADGGATFSLPVQVSDPSRARVGAAVPTVAADGTVVVVYQDFKTDVRDFLNLDGPVWPDPLALVVSRSTDGGAHFGAGHEADSDVLAAQRFVAFDPVFPSVAAGPGGDLTMVWADAARGGARAVLRRSTDLGATWGPRQIVGGGVGSAVVQRLPAVSVAPDGRVDVLDLDNRLNPTGERLDAWLSSSRDGGASFTAVRVNTAPVGAGAAPPHGARFGAPDLGTRIALASGPDAALAGWPGGAPPVAAGAAGVVVDTVGVSVPGALERTLGALALLLLGAICAVVAVAARWPAAITAAGGAGATVAARSAAAVGSARQLIAHGPPVPLPAPPGVPRIRVGARSYPVLLPSLRDPRLHVAGALISVQVLGQVALGFQLSVAQILLAMGASALAELAITFIQRRQVIWPASALLTGNGVALLLRVPGTAHGDWWSLKGANVFLFAALVSLLSKYLIRLRGRHIFNPSNVGLVTTFLVFGPKRSDPQDLWWGPFSPGLALTLAIVVIAGLLITRRLHMLPIVVTFMACFAAFVGVITAAEHCVSARWHVGSLCGGDYWSVLASSPEILIFVFFMITDPQTAPRGRAARTAYGAAVALASALLAAPMRTEFATKVGILGGLVIVCAMMPLSRRWLPGAVSLGMRGVGRLTTAAGRRAEDAVRALVLAGSALLAAAVSAALVAFAAIPAQHSAAATSQFSVNVSQVASRPHIAVDAATLPTVTVDPAVLAADSSVSSASARKRALDAVQDLLILARADDAVDPHLAATAAVGPMLQQAISAITVEQQRGQRLVNTYRFTGLHLPLARNPANYQASLEVTVEVQATVTTVTYTGLTGHTVVTQTEATVNRVLAVQLVGGYYLLSGDYTG